MELSKIMTISGKSGLFVVVSQAKTSVIVESLIDKKRFPVFASEKMSMLSDINVFTEDGDIRLVEVFKKIFDKEGGKPAIDHKSDDKSLKAYFEAVFPEYNKEKVYVSDIKKIISWYNLLQQNNLLDEILKNEAEKNKQEENQAENTEKPEEIKTNETKNSVKEEKTDNNSNEADTSNTKKSKTSTATKTPKSKTSTNTNSKDDDAKPKTKTTNTTKSTKKPTAK